MKRHRLPCNCHEKQSSSSLSTSGDQEGAMDTQDHHEQGCCESYSTVSPYASTTTTTDATAPSSSFSSSSSSSFTTQSSDEQQQQQQQPTADTCTMVDSALHQFHHGTWYPKKTSAHTTPATRRKHLHHHHHHATHHNNNSNSSNSSSNNNSDFTTITFNNNHPSSSSSSSDTANTTTTTTTTTTAMKTTLNNKNNNNSECTEGFIKSYSSPSSSSSAKSTTNTVSLSSNSSTSTSTSTDNTTAMIIDEEENENRKNNDEEELVCIPCKRFSKKQKKSCTICKLPISILSLVTRYLNKYDLFCRLSLTCKVFYSIVHNATCWHDRMFALCDDSLAHLTHDTFMTLVEQCQFRHLCLWQENDENENMKSQQQQQQHSAPYPYHHSHPHYHHQQQQQQLHQSTLFGTKSLCTMFSCTKQTIPMLRGLKTLVLKTWFATPKHLFLALQSCSMLETLTVIYDGKPSFAQSKMITGAHHHHHHHHHQERRGSSSDASGGVSGSDDANQSLMGDEQLCRTMAASLMVKGSPVEKYAAKIDKLKEKTRCQNLMHFKLIVHNSQLCTAVKQQLAVFTHLVFVTQHCLRKIELCVSDANIDILCNDTFVKYGHEIRFDQLEELLLSGHDLSDEALRILLSKCPKLSTLALMSMPSLTAKSLGNLPSSLTHLCINTCPNIGLLSQEVSIPTLGNLTKFSFTSNLLNAPESHIRSEAELVWKIFVSCNSAKLKELVFNTHGVYNPYQVFSCNLVCDNLRNLNDVCLMNSDMNSPICQFLTSNEQSNMKVAVVRDNSADLPKLPPCAVHSLSQKSKCLIIKAYTLPENWLQTFAGNHTVTEVLQLHNCAVEGTSNLFQPTPPNWTEPVSPCRTVQELSLVSRCILPLNYYSRVFATFSGVTRLKLSELNPLPVWTMSIISQHCPLLESLTIESCTYPVMSDEDVENVRVPMCSFDNLKEVTISNTSNPSLQQLCLMLLAMRNVESLNYEAKMGSNMEIQHCTKGARLALVNHFNTGFPVQIRQIIQQAICRRKCKPLSMATFWEWPLFIDVIRGVFDEIFEDNRGRVQTRLATPLFDPTKFPLEETRNDLQRWLTEDNSYIVLREKPDRLASIAEIEQCKVLEKFVEEDSRIKQGMANKGLRLALPILFHHFVLGLVHS